MEKAHIGALFLALATSSLFFREDAGGGILTDKVEEEYDYVIVGGGSAGCVLASRLSEDTDKTVLLLEAGPFYDKTPAFHAPSEWVSLIKSDYAWQYYTEPQRHANKGLTNRQQFWSRGRVLGGSSVTNAMQYTRGSPFEYDQWAANGCTGWSYEDVLPYFLKSEDIQIPELKSSEFHNSGGPLAVSNGNINTKLSSSILKAVQEIGYDLTDYNSDHIDGFSNLQLSVRNGVRESTGVAYLEHTAERKNLDISVESFVTKLFITDKRASGLWFIKDNRKHYVRTRTEIIVAAGAINSPQLLLLSGIGPTDQLKQLGIPVIADLPVGENLQDHELVLLSNKISKPFSINSEWRNSWLSQIQYMFGNGPKAVTGNEVTGYVYLEKSQSGKTNPDLLFIFSSSLSPAESADSWNSDKRISNAYLYNSSVNHGFTTMFMKSHPESRGTLKLRSPDPFDFPLIYPNALSDDSDVQVTIAGIRIWERLIETNTIRELGAKVEDMRVSFCSQHEFRSDDFWECFVRHVATTVYHHSGTCKMGAESDQSAVVDPELRVRGIKGLRVVDTSIFPNVTAGNTNAPAIMVAEKAADIIRGKDTVKHLRKTVF